MKIGLLTSGGDCPGLNAVMRAFTRFAFLNLPRPEILGFKDGYTGLIENNFIPVGEHFFDDLLYTGGTILGSIRQPFKNMADPAEDGVSKLDKMVENYRRLGLDCLVTLGGAGTHKTAAMLSAEGCNVIGLPKTIDNDIWGTEFTFGFDTAAEVAAKCVREMHATAYSHGRTILVEVMGNKTGWLSLYAAVAGGAHACILPEFPYDETALAEYIARRRENGARYDVIVVAEGAMTKEESGWKRKEMLLRRKELGYSTATARIARAIENRAGAEARVQVIGYLQRGAEPNAHDRALCTMMGAFAGELVKEGRFGVTVAVEGGRITYNPLSDIAGRTKFITPENPMYLAAKSTGIYFGD